LSIANGPDFLRLLKKSNVGRTRRRQPRPEIMLLKNARTPVPRLRVKGTQESLMVSEPSQEKLLSKRRGRARPPLKMWN